MTFDFRASQLRTSKIIASGSTGTNAQLLLYPIDAEDYPFNQGNIKLAHFNTDLIGQDVWFFVSGAIGSLDGTSRKVAAFGGDVHISGNLRVGTILFSTISSSLYTLSSSYDTLSSSFVAFSSSYVGTGNAAKGAVRAVIIGDDTTTGLFAYSSGAKTLTFQGNANINDFGVGGYNDFVAGDRVLFTIPLSAACFNASGSWSGIYTITNVGQSGGGGSAPVLTRASDFDTTSEVSPGSFVFAGAGNPDTNAPAIWYLSTSGSVTLDTTPLLFATASLSSHIGSSTILISGNTISVNNSSIGPGHLSTSVVYNGGVGEPLSLDPGGLRIGLTSIGPAYLSASVAGIGLGGGAGQPLSVNVDGLTIQITNDTLTLATGSIGITQLSSSAAGNGLTLGSGLQVLVDPVFQNPLVVSAAGTSVRASSLTQSGYMSTGSYAQLEAVVSYSAIPTTAGGIANATTTINEQTASFNVGVVPANTIWAVKFTTFSVDNAQAVNLVNNIGAFSVYRSGSNNVTQIGPTEIQHSFVSGAFTSVTMSLTLASGQSGSVDLGLLGINTYSIKHWAKFQITEFVYA